MTALTEAWESYDARAAMLPNPERMDWFIEHMPSAGHILDFGGGNGRWTKYMASKRADLTIDILDMRADQLTTHYTIPQIASYITSTFENYTPKSETYDGIWANSALFFIPNEKLNKVIHSLAASLKPNGIWEFNFISSIPDATSFPLFHPMEPALMQYILADTKLTVIEIMEGEGKFGKDKVNLPTYSVRCRKTYEA